MNNLRRLFVLVLASMSCVLLASGCESPIIADPNFHTWCGDQLCAWKLESGEIRKAPTWHRKDFGLELLDAHAPSHITAISQKSGTTAACLDFSVIADVAAEAQVTIGVDFGADGTVDYEQPIAALGFREQKTQITAPPHYVGIKFTISKKGTGRAVLAQIDVHAAADCKAAPVQLQPQAMGTECPLLAIREKYEYDGTACLSGICCEGRCAECCASPNPPREADGGLAPDPLDTCSGGAACGRLPLTSVVAAGQGGYLAFAVPDLTNAVPHQCDPGERRRPAGAECLINDDCASGACNNATWTIDNTSVDGGACAAPPTPDPSCNVSSVHAGHCR